MSNAKLQAARELIQEGRYSEARAVLITMQSDPTAARWIAEIDRRSGTAQAGAQRKRRSMRGWLLLGTAGVCIAAYALGQGDAIPATRTPGAPSATITITRDLTRETSAQQTLAADGLTRELWAEQTLAADGLTRSAEIMAMTRNAPSPMPPFSPVTFQGATGQVVGPITLPAGMYRARVTTTGFFIAQMQITSGQCGVGSVLQTPILFNLLEGMAGGAEAIIRSAGCTTYIETSNITAGWTLEITSIR